MVTFTTTVSRKTPVDGRLEIPASLADRLLSLETPLSVSLGGVEEDARVEEMQCSCNKATSTGHHVHHFLTSDVLRSLVPQMNVCVALDVERGHVHITSDD